LWVETGVAVAFCCASSCFKTFRAAGADLFERRLFGGKIIVETRLPDAEDVRNILRGRAMKATLRKHVCRGFDDLICAAARVWPHATGRCNRNHSHAGLSRSPKFHARAF